MRNAARFLLVFVFLFISLLFWTKTPAFAQTPIDISQGLDSNVPSNLHTLTQATTLEVLSTVYCLLTGQDPVDTTHGCLGIDPNTHKLGYVQNNTGLIGAVGGMTAALYSPPIHFSQYLGYMNNNFGLTKKAYAATTCDPKKSGEGFCGIAPLIPIWSTFRNIVYLLFVIIFIFVGFAIMFRMKIDPRTVMSIENQIPKLIIALLLVTFSFAIAGLLIDGMWLGSFVAIDVLTPIDTANPISTSTVNGNLFQNPLGFSNNVLPGGDVGVAFGAGGSVGDIVKGVLTPYNSEKLGLIPPDSKQACDNNAPFFGGIGNAFCTIGQGVGNAAAGILGFIISWIVDILGAVIILIALLVAMIRLWFSLLLSYVYILLDVILGPFMIAFGVFPGSKMGFSAWIRDIAANLMAFPTAIAMFLLGRILMDAFTTNSGTAHLFVPPLIGNPNGAVESTNPIGWLIGLAIIMMTPKVVDMMKAFLKAPENKFASAIFSPIEKSIGTSTKVASGLINTGFGNLTEYKDGGLAPTKGPLKRAAQAFGVIR